MNTLKGEVVRNEFRRGWPLVALGFAGMALGIPAMPIYGIGLFLPQFTSAFHWSFAAAGFALAILQAVFLFSGPGGGYLLDRFGTYRVAVVCTPLIGLSFISFALLQGSLIQYYVIWGFIALAGAGTSAVVWSRMINQAFVAQRGLALGLAFSGTGFFVFVIKPLLQVVMNAYGWRAGVIVLGLIPLVTLWPAVYFVLRRSRAVSGAHNAAAAQPVTGLTAGQALRNRSYLILLLLSLLTCVLTAIIPHLENIIRNHGFTVSRAAFMASTLGIAMVVGRLLGGYIIDRFWAPAVLAAFMVIAAVALFVLAHASISGLVVLGCVLAFGLAVGSEIHLLGYIVAKYVGLRRYGLLFGFCYGPVLLFGGLGASLVGKLYDVHHDYALALWGASGCLVICAALLLAMGRYPVFAAEVVSAV